MSMRKLPVLRCIRIDGPHRTSEVGPFRRAAIDA